MPAGPSKDAAVAWILPGKVVCAAAAEPVADTATRALIRTPHAGCRFNRIVVLFDIAALPSCKMPSFRFNLLPRSRPFAYGGNLLPQPRSQGSDKASPPHFP